MSAAFCRHGMLRRCVFFTAALCFSLSGYSALWACIHTPADYEEVVQEKTKQAFLFHDGKNAHLIIKTELQTATRLPPTMAWVIPLPSLPSRYKEESPELFKELFEATEPQERHTSDTMTTSTGSAPAPGASGIKVHAAQTVGSYQVQPIEILSEKSGGELNIWLERNGFGAVPAENQAYYLKKGAVFLALKLTNLAGSAAQVKPLHIVYPADRLSVPLKFSSHSGVFDLMLYTLTPRQPDRALIDDALRRDFSDFSAVPFDSTTASPLLSRLVGKRTGYLTRFVAHDFNALKRLVRDMKGDPALSLDGATVLQAAALPSPWAVLPKLLPVAVVLLLIPIMFWLAKRGGRHPRNT